MKSQFHRLLLASLFYIVGTSSGDAAVIFSKDASSNTVITITADIIIPIDAWDSITWIDFADVYSSDQAFPTYHPPIIGNGYETGKINLAGNYVTLNLSFSRYAEERVFRLSYGGTDKPGAGESLVLKAGEIVFGPDADFVVPDLQSSTLQVFSGKGGAISQSYSIESISVPEISTSFLVLAGSIFLLRRARPIQREANKMLHPTAGNAHV